MRHAHLTHLAGQPGQQIICHDLLFHRRESCQLHGKISGFNRVERVLILELRCEHFQKCLKIRIDDGPRRGLRRLYGRARAHSVDACHDLFLYPNIKAAILTTRMCRGGGCHPVARCTGWRGGVATILAVFLSLFLLTE